MSRLMVSEFMTLDGVMEAPGFEEHRDGKNAWALQAAMEDQQRFKVDELFAAGAILLGRVTSPPGCSPRRGSARLSSPEQSGDLATGGDLSFDPLGTVSLRGVPGEWELFEATTTKGD
jgi:hypothetical protein